MITLGITGGIGSGKSYVCRIIATMGIPIYDCDSRAKILYDTDPLLKRSMIALFGSELYKDNQLDKGYLATRIFNDRALLLQVNQLVHPAVRRDIDAWKKKQEVQGSQVCAIESAILISSIDLMERVDRVLVVSASLEQRIERAQKRDNSTREAIEARINNQLSQEEMEHQAHYIVYNNGHEHLLPQIDKILTCLKA